MSLLQLVFPEHKTRRNLHDLVHAQDQLLQHAEQDALRLKSDLAVKDEESRQWRAAYEEARSSPEIKADTEAAFKRGEAWQRKKFASWLSAQAVVISTASE